MQYQFEKLKVWQKSMQLVKEVYQVTKDFPKKELYGLTGQMRRAAVSIPSNIAEGAGRYHRKEYLQFLYTSRGSTYELMSLIQVSRELGYLNGELSQELLALAGEATALLNGLIKSLE